MLFPIFNKPIKNLYDLFFNNTKFSLEKDKKKSYYI